MSIPAALTLRHQGQAATVAAERWLPVVGFEGIYEVSDQGRVRSIPRHNRRSARILSAAPNSRGYPQVGLYLDGKRSSRPVHSLVAAAFLGPRPEGMHVCHYDGDRLNAHVTNLRYGSNGENVLDQVRHGRHNCARRTHCPQGHPYDDKNTRLIIRKDGRKERRCKTCVRARERVRVAHKRASLKSTA